MLNLDILSFAFCYLGQYFHCHNLPVAPCTPAESLPAFEGMLWVFIYGESLKLVFFPSTAI